MENKEYLDIVKKEMPKSKHLKTMVQAFFVGGIICCVGQAVADIIQLIFKDMELDIVLQFTTLTMILLAGILTGFGVYDKIGTIGGAGSVIPITGFANSIVAPAIEHKREGIVLGLCTNMFKIAGPVIVIGITASVVVGLIFWFIGM